MRGKAASRPDVVRAVDQISRMRVCPLGNPAHVKLCPRIDRAMDLVEREFEQTTLAEIVQSGREAGDGCSALRAPRVIPSPGVEGK